ncbi:hypothetical protein CVT25_012572 [Psilocybe cyanescens]|uniref:Non-structural maintenance of chromosomes element 1 homolog n=1 Tax=Psilocybe cyanescens TaxID=93625 RepID=A0A409X7U0_PSICY|nr:hypothetical protein CVT25_012572 [Psilocybe cyanescens]
MVSSGDVDRLFLQAILSRGVMSSQLAQVIWGKCIKAVNESNDALNVRHSKEKDAWEGFVSKINKSLDKLDLEFRALHDESSGKEIKGDEIAQLATEYTPAEITFFKAIVEQIMLAPREAYVISDMAALREPALVGLTSMTKMQAEVILTSFVQKGWLLRSKAGHYSLSTRSLLELLPYLKSNYPDEILECTICLDIMTRGIACHTVNCKTRLHFHCFANYRRRHDTCPSCSTAWPRGAKDKPLLPVGEGAYAGDGRRRTRTITPSDEEDTEEEPEQPSQDPPPPKKAARGNVKKEQRREADMEVDNEEDEEDIQQAPTQATQRPRRSTRR